MRLVCVGDIPAIIETIVAITAANFSAHQPSPTHNHLSVLEKVWLELFRLHAEGRWLLNASLF